MKNKSKIYKLGELFCGPGGFAEGANKTGLFKHVWANDIDEKACETFEQWINTFCEKVLKS